MEFSSPTEKYKIVDAVFFRNALKLCELEKVRKRENGEEKNR